MKTAELTGALLDYWVARALDYAPEIHDGCCFLIGSLENVMNVPGVDSFKGWRPSEDWSQGGPIIEDNMITVTPDPYDDGPTLRLAWVAVKAIYGVFSHLPGEKLDSYRGKTYLIAAMRCYVASKFGDEVPA